MVVDAVYEHPWEVPDLTKSTVLWPRTLWVSFWSMRIKILISFPWLNNSSQILYYIHASDGKYLFLYCAATHYFVVNQSTIHSIDDSRIMKAANYQYSFF
jgi:hypothetical protein